MPTPVSTARQCLAAGDATSALDAAVSSARRRSHSQTTSIHLISSLLSSSSSSLLHDAVSRSHTSSPRTLQLKALHLCFVVALDRLPSSSSSSHHHHDNNPPISNSLMAAIKRSQAHQRRNHDTFHLYHHHQQQQQQTSSSSSSFAGVKVELQELVLAVLDDPVVSRVFGESGFRSCDIKLAVLRPPPPPPPLFLCSFSTPGNHSDIPLPAPDGGDDENCRRIGEVLLAIHNPVLVGVGAANSARGFVRAVEQQSWALLPARLHGLKCASLALDLSSDRATIGRRMEELGNMAAETRVVVSIGDLEGLVEGEGGDCLVSELTRVLLAHRGRLQIIGWSATYEAYMKFLSRYPLLDKDWVLQLLPIITSFRPTLGGLLPITHSLMESFFPFGGFFPAAYEPKGPLSKPYQLAVRCQHCNANYEQEIAAILNGRSASLEDQQHRSIHAWLRKADIVRKNYIPDSTKAKDDRSVLSGIVLELQRKWNDNCQHLHGGCQIETDNFQMFSLRVTNQNSQSADVNQNLRVCGTAFPEATSLQVTKASPGISSLLVSEPKDRDLISKLQVRLSTSEVIQTEGFLSRQPLSELDIQCGCASSPSSETSVMTDLVLGNLHGSPCKEEKSSSLAGMELLEDLSECLPSKVNSFSPSVPSSIAHSSSYPDSLSNNKYLPSQTILNSKFRSGGVSAYDQRCLGSSNMCKQFDPGNFKELYMSLIRKVGRQEEALRAISEAIVRCRIGCEGCHGASLKGGIWLSFLGHDRVGKKRAAMALAELVFGSKENFVCINLDYQGGLCHPNTICDQQDINDHDVRFRGKTVVDHIAEELGKNPLSVVFLENINKADLLVQNNLLRSIHTGKFSDSHGREFSINNAIFVTTSETSRGKKSFLGTECVFFSEERIMGAMGWQMKILLESVSEAPGSTRNANVSMTLKQEPWNRQLPTCSISASKRKVNVCDDRKEQHESYGTSKWANKRLKTFLDLNLPVEDAGESGTDCGYNDESNSVSDDSEAWVEEFSDLMDETVNFRSFDFDALADHVLKEIRKSLQNTIGCECAMEIDVKVMEQILAATWLLENAGEFNNWLEKVLARSFLELRRRHDLSTHTVLRLVACEGALMDSEPGILLPTRIVVE